jgi:hypothetical protein
MEWIWGAPISIPYGPPMNQYHAAGETGLTLPAKLFIAVLSSRLQGLRCLP